MPLDTAAAAELMARTLKRAAREFTQSCGDPVHVALFVGDAGGSRFAHTFESEAEMKDWMTDVLGHCGVVQ